MAGRPPAPGEAPARQLAAQPANKHELGGKAQRQKLFAPPHRTAPPGARAAMLPTPDTSHVPYERVYEPAEDSFLLLDTLSSAAERAFLQRAFAQPGGAAPLVVEVGSGSGVVVGFVHAHARALFGTRAVLAAAVDASAFACSATAATARRAAADHAAAHGVFLAAAAADLAAPWRDAAVDVLVFNPPYVPTPEPPVAPGAHRRDLAPGAAGAAPPSFADDSYLLALAYAGGRDGMETTDRLLDELPRVLSPRGCAYVLLCARNRPDAVRARVEAFGPAWRTLVAGSSGKTAGRESLQVVRIWREHAAA